MTNIEITHLLKENEKSLLQLFEERDQAFWVKQPDGKWSAGQHVIHLVQSSKPLLKALQLPNFIIKWRFGKSNRPSRSYVDVINRYNEKLSAVGTGVVGPFSRVMPTSQPSESIKWLSEISDLNTKINKLTLGYSKKSLETLLLPHPLMGKMTLNEILMWNAYHTEHHVNVLKQKYI